VVCRREPSNHAHNWISDLAKRAALLAVLKFNALQDHCVTILGVETNRIAVGDPLSRPKSISNEEFESEWQFVGIVLKRVGSRSESNHEQR